MALLSNECHMTKHIQDTKLFAKICYNKIIHNTNLFAKVFNLEVLCRFLSDTSAKIELIHLERIFEMLRRLIESCDGISFLFHVQRPLSLLKHCVHEFVQPLFSNFGFDIELAYDFDSDQSNIRKDKSFCLFGFPCVFVFDKDVNENLLPQQCFVFVINDLILNILEFLHPKILSGLCQRCDNLVTMWSKLI